MGIRIESGHQFQDNQFDTVHTAYWYKNSTLQRVIEGGRTDRQAERAKGERETQREKESDDVKSKRNNSVLTQQGLYPVTSLPT